MGEVHITVVTPCLNARATIEATLASVRDQGYQNLDHLVVDGGSTDGTLEVLERAEGIRYVSEPDRGLSDAVNKGIWMAKGDVIGWLNADDLYLAGALGRVAQAFSDHPMTVWATGRCIIIDGAGREIRRGVTRYKDAFLRRYSFSLHLTQNFVSSAATFMSRRALDEVGFLDGGLSYAMDYDLFLRLGRMQPPVYIDHPLAAFRMAEGSLSMTWFEHQFVEHAQVSRRHGAGHPLATGTNALASRVIPASYRAMRAVRKLRRRQSTSDTPDID